MGESYRVSAIHRIYTLQECVYNIIILLSSVPCPKSPPVGYQSICYQKPLQSEIYQKPPPVGYLPKMPPVGDLSKSAASRISIKKHRKSDIYQKALPVGYLSKSTASRISIINAASRISISLFFFLKSCRQAFHVSFTVLSTTVLSDTYLRGTL